MSYPKWVSRGYGLGEILCLNEEDEAAVLSPPEADADDGETVESLRAKLDAAGIAYHPNAGLKKLTTLLPAK